MTQDLTITIETVRQTYRVMNVQFTSKLTVCEDGYRALAGAPADWLYIALTGHRPTEHPNQANCIYANAARTHLLTQAKRSNAWNLAREVVNQWGFYIRPWLGYFLYDKATGKLIEDAPEYYILLNLWTGQRISPAEQLTVVQR